MNDHRKGSEDDMAEGREYISCPDELGTIHISEDVLAVTAAAAALEVEGVGGLVIWAATLPSCWRAGRI